MLSDVSAPPFAGSQLLRGSSTHFMPAAQARPRRPPHLMGFCVIVRMGFAVSVTASARAVMSQTNGVGLGLGGSVLRSRCCLQQFLALQAGGA